MKVLCLDIDGVMNSEKHVLEMHAFLKTNKISEKEYYATRDLPYNETLSLLQKIVKETGAQIVLSSSWRLIPERLEQLKNIFKPYGFGIIDKTCNKVSKEQLEKLNIKLEDTHEYEMAKIYEPGSESSLTNVYDRGVQIAWWLYNHKDVTNFVILDDEDIDIRRYFPDNYVQTYFETGLTETEANKAIEILKRK